MEREILLGKIEQVVNKKISYVEFSEWFEEWFSHDVQQKSCSKEIFGLLEYFYTDIGFYEPNPEIRKEHQLYFGNDVLQMKIVELLGNLTA
jgi:hypothetical protein